MKTHFELLKAKAPSRALTVGALAGGGVGQLLVQAAQEFGLSIGPATATLLGTVLSVAFGYFAKGGRRSHLR